MTTLSIGRLRPSVQPLSERMRLIMRRNTGSKLVEVRVKDIDPDIYFGNARPKFIAGLIEGLDKGKLGVIQVCETPDEPYLYRYLDGYHRGSAVLAKYGPNTLVRVENHGVLPWSKQCELAAGFDNKRGRFHLLEDFRLNFEAGRQVEVDIARTLHQCGGYAVGATTATQIGAVRQLRDIYTMGGTPLLRAALKVVHEAWGPDPKGHSGAILSGAALILNERKDIDPTELTKKLRKEISAERLAIQVAEAQFARWQTTKGRSKAAQSAASRMIEVYNKHRSSRAVPPWGATVGS